MGEKIVVGPVNHGLQTNRTAFNIDNDSFITLINAYQWRGRVKRKRGTSLLGRLQRFFDSANPSYGSITSFNLVAGAGNLLTSFSLQTNGNIVPGSVTLTDSTTGNVYTDPGADGILVGAPAGSGTINYATGAITIAGGANDTITTVTFLYYPDLPVMGLEDLLLDSSQFPGTLGFDTVYSYNVVPTFPYPIYDVSFYKNPTTATYPGYTTKTNVTPVKWNGNDYQQFWTTNYEGALWATNGVPIPFDTSKISMQFKPIITVDNITGGPPAFADLTITAHGLVVGDFVFVNEVVTTTGINLQTGYVVAVVSANKVTVEFPNATIATNGAGGIAQYLTSNADATKDCIRWYDGDPTNGNPTTPTLNGKKGWVNFSPPLSQFAYSIDQKPPAIYYLAGAKMILPYKDRLLFLGPVIQSSSNAKFYLQDTIIFSQFGTPYYTASFTGDPTILTTVQTPILVPDTQTANAAAYFEDSTGFGGYISAGYQQAIKTAGNNEDVLLIGFTNREARLVYTGNDIIPFNFFIVNSELGSASTFSVITLDRGVLTIGEHGIVQTSQVGSARIDLEIPDQIFQFNLLNNGADRVTAQRDFINEWIYFTYPSNEVAFNFPNQTLQFNYRDNSWAIFNECYTTYGQFRRRSGFTWATVSQAYPTWSVWTDPWNAGTSTLEQVEVIAGNQQGFVIFRDDGTDEGISLYIQSFSGGVITAPNHCLNTGDFIIISGCIGTISSMVNDKIFKVGTTTTNTFTITAVTGTYFGGGVITRMYVPLIQTKQFPVSWGSARKTRIGCQQYLFTTTAKSQITLQIYLSQNTVGPGGIPYNAGPILPDQASINDSLVYSDVLFTCPESTNLGLTPANINLQMVTSGVSQAQTWHRINTSLIGDTVQLGFTLSDAQMLAVDDNGKTISQFSEIEMHGFILDVQPSQLLA